MVKEEVVVVVVVVQITVAMVVVAVATTITKATVLLDMVVFLPMWGTGGAAAMGGSEIVSDVNDELTTSDRECMAFNAGPGPPIQMSANDQGPDGLIYLCFTFLIGVPIVNCMICLHLMVVLFRVEYFSIMTKDTKTKNKHTQHQAPFHSTAILL